MTTMNDFGEFFDRVFDDSFFESSKKKTIEPGDNELKRENRELHSELHIKNQRLDNQAKSIMELQHQKEYLQGLVAQKNAMIKDLTAANNKLKLENSSFRHNLNTLQDVIRNDGVRLQQQENDLKTTRARLGAVLSDIVNGMGLSDYYKNPINFPELLNKIIVNSNLRMTVFAAVGKAKES